MKEFFRNHRGFIFGFVSGTGFALFLFEAFSSLKQPLIYIGGLGLLLCGRILYSKIRQNGAPVSDPARFEIRPTSRVGDRRSVKPGAATSNMDTPAWARSKFGIRSPASSKLRSSQPDADQAVSSVFAGAV
jgi:hypothetical protein